MATEEKETYRLLHASGDKDNRNPILPHAVQTPVVGY